MRFQVILFFAWLGVAPLVLGETAKDYFNEAKTAYDQGDFMAAVDDDQKAIEKDPKNWRAYQSLGNAYFHMGKTDDARAAYQQSLDLYPNNPSLKKFIRHLSASTPAAAVSVAEAAPVAADPNKPLTGTPLSTPAENGLPMPGSLAWSLGLAGSAFGFDDLEAAYGSAIFSTQTPYGAELDLGADLTLFSGFQAGIQFQGMTRFPEKVSFTESGSGTETDEWDTYVLGGALGLKAYLPLGPKDNFIFYGECGVYALAGSHISMSDTNGNKGTLTLDGSNIGGAAGVELEFLQGVKSSWALDAGLGYRYLKISPITFTRTVNGTSGSAHLLANADGTNAEIDLSGLRLNVTVRFF